MTQRPTKTDPAPKGKVTLKNIADHVGVSVSTVSRSLSGAPGISVDVRDKIRSAAKSLDYSGLGQSYSIIVAVDVHAIESGAGEFMQAVQRGIEAEATTLGLSLSVQHIVLKSAPIADLGGRADGYLLLSLQDENVVRQLVTAGTPAVIVNGREPLMRLDAVAPANRAGGYLGTKHLLDLGHRDILFLGHSKRPTIRDRMLGNQRALSEAGIDTKSVQSIDLPEMRADVAYQQVSDFIRQNGAETITAIQCCNDASALGAMAALSEAGLRIPDDISVVGFDDVPAAALNSTPLTTLRVATQDLGARGLNRLLDRIQNPDQLVTYTETAVSLIERASTAKR